jgi:4,5-dihydroxyphthalate decarboxylase
MADLELTIALERYDRHVPFFMGTVSPPAGITLKPLEVGMAPPRRDGIDRHRRMFQDNEFDICEQSFSSYIIATSRGAPYTAIPVFPRRLFSQNHIFVNRNAGIETPADLIGKRVAVRTLQTTMSVLALGDLKFEYGADWRDINWVTETPEVLPIDTEGVSVERAPEGRRIGDMLVDGEVDAMINPHPPPRVLQATDKVRYLFPDRRAEALKYYAKHGYYPIMHIMVFQNRVVEEHPGLPRELMRMWEDAKQLANGFYEDPGYSQLAFARSEFETQQDELGADPWPSGLAANRVNIERFMEYSADQGLIEEPYAPERLFHPSVLDT